MVFNAKPTGTIISAQYKAKELKHHSKSSKPSSCLYEVVFILSPVKLNLGYKAPMGAVMVYRQNTWNLICDSGLSNTGAQVVCRQLGFQSGVTLQGSVFGSVDASVGIVSVRCRGIERDFSLCYQDVGLTCSSQKYASVFCSSDVISGEGTYGVIWYRC